MAAPAELSLQDLGRSALCVIGALVLALGLGNAIVGRTKIEQYEAIVRTTPPAVRDPAQLFPPPSEAQERRTIAVAKLGYYQLLFTAGQAMSALGFVLLVVGVLRVRLRLARTQLTS
jgi:hypothetical protein